MNPVDRADLRALASGRRPATLAMPIASFPGAQITGATVHRMVTDPTAQAEALVSLHERFRTRVVLTCMDLSVEAEVFGAEVRFADDEVPTVLGRRVTTVELARSLAIPNVGTHRTGLQLQVVRTLVSRLGPVPVIAGVTGPFSTAARLLGVSEALVLTLEDPSLVHVVVEKCATFLTRYLVELRAAGAAGVFMAEPTAGLLSPRGLAAFAIPAIKAIASAVERPDFTLLLHNCAAKPAHLPALLQAGISAFHFGAPMDLRAALEAVPSTTLVAGNLDPTAVFVGGTPEEVGQCVRQRLAAFGHHDNYVLSSGCDLPRRTPLENLAAFFEAAESSDRGRSP